VSSLYFFTIRDLDRSVKDDPHGTDLPNVADALSYAEHKISDLRHELDYDNPRLIMIVEDEDRHSVWSLPFLPANSSANTGRDCKFHRQIELALRSAYFWSSPQRSD
jgi:hypothetical protein